MPALSGPDLREALAGQRVHTQKLDELFMIDHLPIYLAIYRIQTSNAQKLSTWIKESAPRLFAVLISCRQERYIEAFFEDSIDDDVLTSNLDKASKKLPESQQDRFREAQSRFPPKLKRNAHMEVASGVSVPFQLGTFISAGGFGAVFEVNLDDGGIEGHASVSSRR